MSARRHLSVTTLLFFSKDFSSHGVIESATLGTPFPRAGSAQPGQPWRQTALSFSCSLRPALFNLNLLFRHFLRVFLLNLWPTACRTIFWRWKLLVYFSSAFSCLNSPSALCLISWIGDSQPLILLLLLGLLSNWPHVSSRRAETLPVTNRAEGLLSPSSTQILYFSTPLRSCVLAAAQHYWLGSCAPTCSCAPEP